VTALCWADIARVRAFVQKRRKLATHDDLRRKIEEMEKRYDANLLAVFPTLRQMLETPLPPKRQIGFPASTRAVQRVLKSRCQFPTHSIQTLYLSTTPLLPLENSPRFR
jgi:hypothetical protein